MHRFRWLLTHTRWKLLRLFGAASIVGLAASGVAVSTSAWAFEVPAALALEVAPKAPLPDPGVVAFRVRPPVDLDYNVFCPTCVAAPTAVGSPGTAATPGAVSKTGGIPLTKLPLELAATLEAGADSLAVVVNVASGRRGPFAVGDALAPGVVVSWIGAGRIRIDNQGRLEALGVDDAPPRLVDPTSAQPKPPKPRNTKPPTVAQSIAAGVSCAGEVCTVDRSMVRELLASPQKLMGLGSVRPKTLSDGRTGYALGRGPLPKMFGLRRGDVLTMVGGEPITIDRLFALRRQLEVLPSLELSVQRKGKLLRRTIEFN